MKSPNDKFSKYVFCMYLAGIAFALNWVWEIVQMSAYKSTDDSMIESLFFCTLATAVDAVTILTIYEVAATIMGPRDWKLYPAAALLGSFCALLFEKTAFTFGWWDYNDTMPVLPILGTGLLPFVQLTTLGPLSMWLTAKATSRSAGGLG
ncbi:MAG: hypothetical protein WKF92_15695 [Pyrinomonadaceae bacterium]